MRKRTPADREVMPLVYTDEMEEIHSALITSNYSRISKWAPGFAKERGLDPDSLAYRTFCREFLKVQYRYYKILLEREDGNYEYERELAPAQLTNAKPTETLTDVIKEYVSENESKWTPKTKAEIVDDSLGLFVEIMGNVPLQSLDRRALNNFKTIIKQLPPNRNKLKKYRDKSIEQLLKMDVDKTLAERTVNKHLTRIGTLFDFAITNGFYDGPNPALKMQLPLSRSDEESRAAYTSDELESLLVSEKYIEDSFAQSYQFWTPIIALYTGMRQNEIAQLYLDDIRQDDGIWIIDINVNSPDKSLKNRNARRLVPVHPFLIVELKLHQYVEQLRAKGEKRLFPEIKPDRDGYGGPVSKWFNWRYKGTCGIASDGRQKDFHSFRATFMC